MKLSRGLLLLPLVLLVACGGGEGTPTGMDGMIDGVPVEEYDTTTTRPTETTAATTSTTTVPTERTAPPETTVPAEAEAVPEDPEDLVAWRAATAALCAEYGPRIQAFSEAQADPETLAEAAAYFDRVNPLTARYLRAIVAVAVPDSRQDDVVALYALADGMKETARVAQAAAHYDDQASFDEALTELDALGQSANEALLDLGVPECVSEEDGGTA